jgi:hypothetical protein
MGRTAKERLMYDDSPFVLFDCSAAGSFLYLRTRSTAPGSQARSLGYDCSKEAGIRRRVQGLSLGHSC